MPNEDKDKVEETISEEVSASVQTDEPKLQKEKKQKKEKKPTGQGLIYFLLLIIIAVLVAAAYYYFQEQKNQQAMFKQQDNELLMLGQKINDNDNKNKSRDEAIAQNNQQLQLAIANTDEAIKTSQQATELVNRTQRGWALAEVDYLLRMAHRRLEVARDVAGAVAALKGADSRIEELGDLKLFKIRKQLAKDIASLNAVKQADVNGVVLAVDQMLEHATELPFKSVQSNIQAKLESRTPDDAPEQTKPETDKTFVDSVIETVKQIGDIKIHQRSLNITDSGIQQKQVEQLLYNHLIALRLAALSYDQKSFTYEIDQTNDLLTKYYETDSNSIKQFKESLNNYKEIQLLPLLPELTQAWVMLQEELSRPVNKIQQESK